MTAGILLAESVAAAGLSRRKAWHHSAGRVPVISRADWARTPEERTRPRGLGVPPSRQAEALMEHRADLRGPASGGDMPTRQLFPRRRREARDLEMP